MDAQASTLATGELLQTIEIGSVETIGTHVNGIVRNGKTRTASPSSGELLIPDSRADLSPAQSVERKLTHILRGASIPVSHIRLSKRCGRS